MSDGLRIVAIMLGTIVIGAALANGGRYFKEWRATGERRCLWLTIQRFGSAAGCMFILLEIADRVGSPLTWRSPLALLIFGAVLVAILGAWWEERN